MAARKTTGRKKQQYVKARKRKGTERGVVAKRSFVVVLVFLILGSILLGIGLGFRWIGQRLFSENPRFRIQHLVIATTGKISEKNVREWTGLHEGTNLFAFGFQDIRDKLKDVPLVESVDMKRELPSTFYIRVKERVPVSRIELKQFGLPRPVDRYGYILSPSRSASIAQLPLIKGFDEELSSGDHINDPGVNNALEIINLCESNHKLSKYVLIESLDIQYNDYIDMRLQGGTRVLMARYRLAPKLQKLATIIQLATEQGKRVKDVDLTLESQKTPVRYY